MYETKRNVDRNLFRSSRADWIHHIYIDNRQGTVTAVNKMLFLKDTTIGLLYP